VIAQDRPVEPIRFR